jgi:hypothetical protein
MLGTMQHHAQSMAGMQRQQHANTVPTVPGQDVLGAIQEIVPLLETDLKTDRSRVDLETLRRHLNRWRLGHCSGGSRLRGRRQIMGWFQHTRAGLMSSTAGVPRQTRRQTACSSPSCRAIRRRSHASADLPVPNRRSSRCSFESVLPCSEASYADIDLYQGFSDCRGGRRRPPRTLVLAEAEPMGR